MPRMVLRTPIFREDRSGDTPGIVWENAPVDLSPQQLAFLLRYAEGSSRVAIERAARRLPDARKYLKIHADDYYWSRPVLEHGRIFTAKDPGPDWKPMKPWSCFENAMGVAKKTNGRIAYAEGICVSPFGARLHAWNVERGAVLDYTWPMAHLNRYFGIMFDIDWMRRMGIFRQGCVFGYWEPVKKYLEKRAPG